MKVLIACEFSGIVRDAFIARGHDAISCDLLPTERPGPHIQGDVLQYLYPKMGWDMMIAHPPCTYLCVAGLHYSKNNAGRMSKTLAAMDFFIQLYESPIAKVCIENPVGYINTAFRKPEQIIEPFYFGERERKKTCLWLKGLLPLIHIPEDTLFEQKTHTAKPKPLKTIMRKSGTKKGQPYNYYWRQGKTGKERSRTFQGIANAMAEQWG